MKNNSIKSKIITGLVMASMAVFTSSVAFATNTVTGNTSSSVVTDVQPPPGGGGEQTVVTGTGAYTVSGDTVTKSNQDIIASEVNQSVVKVTNKGTLTILNSTLTKGGGNTSSEDSSNFYGVNAGVLAEAGSTINIDSCAINTSAEGSNGIFATGAGSTINVSNVTINTTGNSSRGLDATLTGTVNAKNIKITTNGAHCAALATDRGRGTINVIDAVLNTAGEGSPGVYSTGIITVANANITATGSEAAAIEGKNSISLTDTTISGAKKRGVMMYQSYSGDAEVGTSAFTMNRGVLTAAEGPLFYITNTDAIINLKNIKATATSGKLLTACADSWGTTGVNGGNVTLNADSQTLTGDITCDKISTISVLLKNSSNLKSTINTENTGKSVAISLDSTSTWNVTGSSYVTSLTDADSTLGNIDDNGNTIYYDSTVSANSWLNGNTITLKDGGKLAPGAK